MHGHPELVAEPLVEPPDQGATTGQGDLMCRVVARTNEHLQHVINAILRVNGIVRTTTTIALTEQMSYRVLPLVSQVIRDS